MFTSYKFKDWISWPLIRAHLCTLAIAVGFNSSWRAPREAFRYGGLQFGLVVTVAMVTVAVPISLLQLVIGQLSQQDAVGVWRAVPFFRGVGYIRLLISFVGSTYSMVYLALTFTYILYISSNSIPFDECVEMLFVDEEIITSTNTSSCLEETFMAPVSDKPEYYLAVALMVLFLWVVMPFLFYNSVKLMKRILYVLGPTVLVLAIVISSCIGDKENLYSFVYGSDWSSFLEPAIWHGAVTQALLSSQIAGGYLISAGDILYSSTNVQWTTLAFVGANVLSLWGGILFWYGVTGPERDVTGVAVIVQAYQLGETSTIAWPLAVLTTLLLSGIITMLCFMYPMYDRFRRMGGVRWRVLSVAGSVAGAVVSLGFLAGRLPALELLEDVAVPFLISLATVLEILAFVFIYGWKVLVEDVEFLIGGDLSKFWVWGWCAAPGIITPFAVWWVAGVFLQDLDWSAPPWQPITVIVSALVALIILVAFAIVSVVRQVQYDCFGKLKSSFEPSRHWGPRDPITHYYWLARRDEVDSGNLLRTRYQRRELGQLSGRPSFLIFTSTPRAGSGAEKKRSNSDDMLYTVHRKQKLNIHEFIEIGRRRSKSMDWSAKVTNNADIRLFELDISFFDESVAIKENNNNNVVNESKNNIRN